MTTLDRAARWVTRGERLVVPGFGPRPRDITYAEWATIGSFRVRPELKTAFVAVCEQRGLSQNELMGAILDEYLFGVSERRAACVRPDTVSFPKEKTPRTRSGEMREEQRDPVCPVDPHGSGHSERSRGVVQPARFAASETSEVTSLGSCTFCDTPHPVRPGETCASRAWLDPEFARNPS